MSRNERYKKAVWDFLMEHSDVADSGQIFVKFHTDNRKDFEARVWARFKGYHRIDSRPVQRKKKEEFNRKQFELDNKKRLEKSRSELINKNIRLLRWLRWLPQSIKELILK